MILSLAQVQEYKFVCVNRMNNEKVCFGFAQICVYMYVNLQCKQSMYLLTCWRAKKGLAEFRLVKIQLLKHEGFGFVFSKKWEIPKPLYEM